VLSREQIRSLLFNQGVDSRFTQDSPVLPDVWIEYAQNPGAPVDLLLTPYQDRSSTSLSPALLASELTNRLREDSGRSKYFDRIGQNHHEIAINQTTVAVRLWFDELVRVVLPLSSWWNARVVRAQSSKTIAKKALNAIDKLQTAAGRKWLAGVFAKTTSGHPKEMTEDVFWLMLVIGVISMSHRTGPKTKTEKKSEVQAWPMPDSVAARQEYFDRLFSSLTELFSEADIVSPRPSLVHLVSRNRPAMTCLQRSVPAVKADAAVNLFKIDCSEITWAVADSGIDARHPAFQRRSQVTGRVGSNSGAELASTTRLHHYSTHSDYLRGRCGNLADETETHLEKGSRETQGDPRTTARGTRN
jgi:serine protease AprX